MTNKPDLKRAVRSADALLHKYNIRQPPVPVELLIEQEGLIVQRQPLEINVSGVLVRRADRTFVGVNSLHHRNRQRFTLAHELGHFLLHEDSPTVWVDDAVVHFRGEDVNNPGDIREMEANAFAGALLLPAQMLRDDLSGKYIDINDESAVREMARRYQVSPQALTIRLARLGLIGGIGGLLRPPY